MTSENPLALDVATRTTRGRSCPRCGGKIIPSDRAIYQSAGNPDAVFPIWQCERCGYEEMSAQLRAKAKAEPAKALKGVVPAAATRTPAVAKPKVPVQQDLQGRPYPPDVLQLLERLKAPATND